ncbi:MAG: protein kinase, partial [Oscillospiraceae bacterium]|nr:protein kinase [Oscillospiraceae bacterium]
MIINRCWNCMEDMGNSGICPHCGYDPSKAKPLTYALKPNTILRGKYLIGNVLGQGGFGITYIGFDLALEMKVAIKEYFPFDQASRNTNRDCSLSWQSSRLQEDSWSSGCRKFLAEARKMAKINSIPEIVSVRDTFEENKTAYIVMDYVPGMTLKEHIRKRGCFSYEECMELLLPLIDGIDKVHRQGIIHRDISPANLMLTPNGKVYLLDLGAAKDMKDSNATSQSVATRGFSPMEQYANAGQIGPWTDVYAITASIYYCLFGKVPPAAVDRVDNDILDFKGKGKNALTKAQIAVLKKGMSVKKELRYQSVMELFIALRDARKKKSPWKWIAAAAAVAVVAGIVGTLLVTTPWLPTVESYGSAGTYAENALITIPGQYKYYVDLEDNLLKAVYNEETDSFDLEGATVVYAQDPEVEGDGISSLNIAEDKVYAVYRGGEGGSDYLISMNLDGSDQKQLLELTNEHTKPHYVKFSNGDAYVYYMMDDGSSEDAYNLHIYRYDIQKDSVEMVVEETANWFCLYEKYMFYTVWNEETETYILKRATLDGKQVKTMDQEHSFWNGIVADGNMYLLQTVSVSGEQSMGLVMCDVNGKPVNEGSGVFGVDWINAKWTVGGGWVYYSENGSSELYRVRLDGTSRSQVLSGYQFEKLSYSNGELYFHDGKVNAEGVFEAYQAYFVNSDGTDLYNCEMESSRFRAAGNGILYRIEDGVAVLKGYNGLAKDVILPQTIEGYPVSAEIDWDNFEYGFLDKESVIFYTMIDLSELAYSKNASGIIINSYTGSITGSCENIAIPTEIDGVPVIEIAQGVFKEKEFVNVYLPEQLLILGHEVFKYCENLKHVVIPDTLLEIGSYTFADCSLDGEEIVLPEGLTDIGMGAF